MKGDEITYFDHSELGYSSFFLNGFYEIAEDYGYRVAVTKAPPHAALRLTAYPGWKQELDAISLYRARLSGEEFLFCIDARDAPYARNENIAGYHFPLLDKVRWYFKVNYNEDCILGDPQLRRHSEKIIPVAPPFPVRVHKVVPFLGTWLSRPWSTPTPQAIGRKLRGLFATPTLRDVTGFRNQAKDHDVVFVMRFYDQDCHSAHNAFRYELMKLIRDCPRVSSITGFASRKLNLPGKFASFHVRPYSHGEHLRCLARSRIGIYVKGLTDCLSFKLPQFLALGLPIIGQKFGNNRGDLYRNPHFTEQFSCEGPQEILDKVLGLLEQPERMSELGKSNAALFDTEFSPRAVAKKMLLRLLSQRPSEVPTRGQVSGTADA